MPNQFRSGIGVNLAPPPSPTEIYRGASGAILYGNGLPLSGQELVRFEATHGDPSQFLPPTANQVNNQIGSAVNQLTNQQQGAIRESEFLKRIYGTKDTTQGSATFGQYLPLDQQFLAMLNNREMVPAPIATVGAANPQASQAAQAGLDRKLQFMTSLNPQINPPPGPPMARDNGQSIARR